MIAVYWNHGNYAKIFIKMEEEAKITPEETKSVEPTSSEVTAQEETKSPDPTPSEVFERIEYSKPEFWNDRFRE